MTPQPPRAATGAAAASIERCEGDWIDALEPPFRAAFRAHLEAMPLARLHRYPPPKKGGLPIGQEGRILRRFLTNGSSQLDASAFSGLYRSLASRRERVAFRGLVLGEALEVSEWADLLGAEALGAWRERGLLSEQMHSRLESTIRVYRVGDLTLVADPLTLTYEESFPNRVHIGQDSLNLLEFLAPRVDPGARRILEVGPGSGVVLLTLSRGRTEAVGVDINPRAVRVSRLNAELNALRNVRIEQSDIFAPTVDLPRFDLVYWNTPLLFLPESERARVVDGFGGHLGIELAINFIERLPSLLADGGLGVVAALPPVLDGGVHPLERALEKLAPRLSLDLTVHVTQSSWLPELRAFHRQFSIDHFENVFIEVRAGTGRLRREPPGPWRRAIDRLRGRLYEAKSGGDVRSPPSGQR